MQVSLHIETPLRLYSLIFSISPPIHFYGTVSTLQVASTKHFNLEVKYLQVKGGDAMNTHDRLEQLMRERGWSMYKLSKESGLSESTIRNLFKRNTTPSIETLKIICQSFGITLSQFFAEGEMVEMSPTLKELFDLWVNLTPAQKAALKSMMQAMQEN